VVCGDASNPSAGEVTHQRRFPLYVACRHSNLSFHSLSGRDVGDCAPLLPLLDLLLVLRFSIFPISSEHRRFYVLSTSLLLPSPYEKPPFQNESLPELV